jgi:hypothetical protein
LTLCNTNPFFSNTTFQNFSGISDLLSEVSTYTLYLRKCIILILFIRYLNKYLNTQISDMTWPHSDIINHRLLCPGCFTFGLRGMVLNWSKESPQSFLVHVPSSLCYMWVRLKQYKPQDLQKASPSVPIPQTSIYIFK